MCKMKVLESFMKLTGKYICQDSLYNKVAHLQPAPLLHNRLRHSCQFCKHFKSTFLNKQFWGSASATVALELIILFSPPNTGYISIVRTLPLPLKGGIHFKYLPRRGESQKLKKEGGKHGAGTGLLKGGRRGSGTFPI